MNDDERLTKRKVTDKYTKLKYETNDKVSEERIISLPRENETWNQKKLNPIRELVFQTDNKVGEIYSNIRSQTDQKIYVLR